MEAGVVLLLVFALLGISPTLGFYGDSISFMPPRKKSDGTLKVTFHHRQNGRRECNSLSPSYTCETEVCTSFEESRLRQTDMDDTGQYRWCQSEGHTTATVSSSKTYMSLSGSGCCWASNVDGKTNWTSLAELDLGRRSDSHALNHCPVTTTVSSLRVPQNCFSRLSLLAHDPDGDHVRCSFISDAATPANFTMDETMCVLKTTGEVAVGVHVFELMLEDFSRKNITLTYEDGTSAYREASDMTSPPLCKVKLQFSMEILPTIPSCESGHVIPMFLSRTPLHGHVLYATAGQQFQLSAEALATHASIHDFQVSGPQNMTKVFQDNTLGKAEVTLSWTPQHSDLYRVVPVCFTAETNESQSSMRCVVVMVTQASLVQGKVTVTCLPNMMKVALEKATMPDIDVNFLTLRDPSCSLTSNGTHITGSMSFSTCGTTLEDMGDFLVFTNDISSFVLDTEVIVRRRKVKIDVMCQFPKFMSISNYYNLHKTDYIFTESSFGSFGYSFEIYLDSNFTDKVPASAYPVEINLLQTIYMGIQSESDLTDVTVFIESCKATPDDNPDNTLSYDLIRNGCKKDQTLEFYPSDSGAANFEVQAFKFTGNYDQIYITCSVILCETGNPISRCARGCEEDASRRRKRSLTTRETVAHSITQGPLQFVSEGSDREIRAVASPDFSGGSPDVSGGSPDVSGGSPVASGFSPDASGGSPDASGGFPDASGDSPDASGGSRGGRGSGRGGSRGGSGGRYEIKQILNSNISAIVFASAFLVSVVLMAVVVSYFMRKKKAEDRKSLLVSGLDN